MQIHAWGYHMSVHSDDAPHCLQVCVSLRLKQCFVQWWLHWSSAKTSG